MRELIKLGFADDLALVSINQSINLYSPKIKDISQVTSAVENLKVHKTYCIQITERSKIIYKNYPIYKNILKSISLYIWPMSTFFSE